MTSTSAVPGTSRRRRRWVVVAVLAAWALVLVAAGVWSAHTDPASVREQSDLVEGRQTLDRAVETVITAAGSGVSTDIGGYEVTTGCRITLARQGTTVEQRIVLGVPDGQESVLLERLLDRLPSQWEPRLFRSTDRLAADAGDFVSVSVAAAEQPGEVHVTFSTGCRPGDDPALTGGQ